MIHLHVHTAYSLAEGALPVKSLPKLCRKYGMPAIAITDTHNLFGAMEFSLSCLDVGIQPIIGCQAFVTVFEDIPPSPLVLLVQNEEGYKNLSKLLSDSYCQRPNGLLAIPLNDLLQHSQGLISLSGGVKGPLGTLLDRQDSRAQEVLRDLKGSFGNRFYLEIQRHHLPEERRLEPVFLEMALEHDIPIVATNDVYFESPDLYEAHDALLCISEGRYVSEDDRRKVTPHHYFKSTKEMEELFKDLPEALENTVNIAQRCAFSVTCRLPILPRFPTVNGKDEEAELRTQAQQGLEMRLAQEVFPLHPQENHQALRETYQKRLEHEVSVIQKMGFPGYFLIVSDFIRWAKKHNIPVGPGRGSGAGSLVAWVLDITDMDPLRFNLIFERFLNPERVSMPDFDVDFCQDRRDEVIAYVRERYGEDRVAHIITFGKLQARAVLRDVGRVLQMPYGQVDRICKLIPQNPADPVSIEKALVLEPALKQQQREDETVAKLIDMGQKLEGLYRHASTHAAGVVIGDRPLYELVPLYKDDDSHLPATQFNMKGAEQAGLVKFDFLGLKTLTVIQASAEMIRKSHKPDFDIRFIPLDDAKTFELLTNVRTIGVFQLESGGMKDVLKKLKPDRFEDLIALVALFRPGPMDDIPRYLACKHGQEPVVYLHPSLEPILKPTYGVMVYQEQVMQIAQVLGGYSLGEADLLRRAMGKKIKAEMDAQRGRFVTGALQQGVSEDIASRVFDQMAKFAGYGFNKSHSAPYALLAYQTAYLKAHYPQEFFAATMTYDMHNLDKINAYRQDMEAMGIDLLPPDIQHSVARFSVEGSKVRYALAAIKNVGEQAMNTIVQDREARGQFKDFKDFLKRGDSQTLNKRQMENLIAAGAFDSLCKNRRQVMEEFEKGPKVDSKQGSLFGEPVLSSKDFGPDWPMMERLDKEFASLGFYLSAHPLDVYKEGLKALKITSSSEIAEYSGTAISLVGVILNKQERTSKAGQKFAFVTFSDHGGNYEVVFFSDALVQYRDMLNPGSVLYITAALRKEESGYRLMGQRVEKIEDKLIEPVFILELTDFLDIDALIKDIQDLKLGKTQLKIQLKELKARLSLPQLVNITPEFRGAWGKACEYS